jgi:hypothetical protein
MTSASASPAACLCSAHLPKIASAVLMMNDDVDEDEDEPILYPLG